MYDYVWIPSSIKEMRFIINNNPNLFPAYFKVIVNRDNPRLVVFYYNKRSRKVENYDWEERMGRVEMMEYINRCVKNVYKTDLATFVSVFKNIKYRNIVKY